MRRGFNLSPEAPAGGGGSAGSAVQTPAADAAGADDPAALKAKLAESERLAAERANTLKGKEQELTRFRNAGMAPEVVEKFERLFAAGKLTPEALKGALEKYADVIAAPAPAAEPDPAPVEDDDAPLTRKEAMEIARREIAAQAKAERDQSLAKRNRELDAEKAALDAALAALPDDVREDARTLAATRLNKSAGADALGFLPATADQIRDAVAYATGRLTPATPTRQDRLAPTAEEARLAAGGSSGGPGGPSGLRQPAALPTLATLKTPEEREAFLAKSIEDRRKAREARAVPASAS